MDLWVAHTAPVLTQSAIGLLPRSRWQYDTLSVFANTNGKFSMLLLIDVNLCFATVSIRTYQGNIVITSKASEFKSALLLSACGEEYDQIAPRSSDLVTNVHIAMEMLQ